MDFDQTEDRRMLAETLNRFLADRYDIATRNTVAYDAPWHSPDLWAQMAELGILHALADEDHGGMGGTGFDITTVFEELGRALCPEPVLGALMGLRLLSAAGAETEAVLEGTERLAVAIAEPEAPWGLDHLETRASKAGDGWALTGRKSVVYGGPSATRFLVAALEGDMLGLYEVAAGDARITPYGMVEGGGAAELFLDASPAKRLIPDARTALQDALNAGMIALCAEAVGVAERMKEMLLEHLKTRTQFGRTIGSFQALQHRTVDLVTEIEQMRSITILAADALGGPEADRKAAMAKNLIGRAGRLMSEETMQMHGGIGVTWEAAVSHYAKRIVMIDAQLGDTDYCLSQVMEGLQVA
ncbi:acyl-CoA dehydrogenase family protein [Acidimangrovimonas sediminis]|uniref:acyl-CoA dehydrogenase family protein n=1 Tax=Acidimangrovimonas sediminis TaxID=2056283 RepID=UPI000C7FC689|nr:acyl-CoA dehydrogenase family protein [Acidimangrovimonas sediminis]